MNKQCTGCVVSAGTHKPAEALHQQIAAPKTQQPEALRLLQEYRKTMPSEVLHLWANDACDAMFQQHERIAELEGQLEAIGAGGVEPLRKPAAAPQDWQGAVAEAAQARAAGYEGDDRKDIKTDVFNAFAKGADWERRRAALAATQPAAQGMEARDEAFEAVRKVFCKLQRYSFFLDSRNNVRRCADHCGNWVEFEAVHTLFEPQSVDAALAAQAKQVEAIASARTGGCGCCSNACADREDGCRHIQENPSVADMKGGA